MSHPLEALQARLRELAHSNSENVEPWHSFWHYRPTRAFPPASIRDPEQWQGGERLALACTQTDLPAAAQKKLVQRWCEILPTLTEVRFLWLQSRAAPELFEAACRMPGLVGFYVKWSGVKDFSPITQRATTLRYLYMGSSPSLTPLSVLGDLPLLEWLELENVRAAADLGFVSALQGLRGLGVHGDRSGPRILKVTSLQPLQALDKLTWLSLTALRSADSSLATLAELPSLRHLLINNGFPWQEYAILAGRRPDIECDHFQPVSEPVNWTRCKHCGQMSMVMLTGKGSPLLCQHCDTTRVQQFAADFEALRASCRG